MNVRSVNFGFFLVPVGRLVSSNVKLQQAVCVSVCPGLKPHLSTLRLVKPHQLIMRPNTSHNSNQHYQADGNFWSASHEFLQHRGDVDQVTDYSIPYMQ